MTSNRSIGTGTIGSPGAGTLTEHTEAQADTVRRRRVEYARAQATKGIWHEVGELTPRAGGRYLVDDNGYGLAYRIRRSPVFADGHIPSYVVPSTPLSFRVVDGCVEFLDVCFGGRPFSDVTGDARAEEIAPPKRRRRPTLRRKD